VGVVFAGSLQSKSEDSGPLNWVKIYALSQIIIDGNDCLLA
jgi:hypothetical protein